jgi:nicotinamide-nucleotide amidase
MPAVRTAAILAVGSELLTPHRIDTNSLFLTGRLNEIGIEVMSKTVIGDNEQALRTAVRRAMQDVDVVITSGGLGPTADDLTREAVAAELGLALVEDDEVLATIRRRFERRGLRMPDGNRRQAAVPQDARVLPNPHGTAPGLLIEADSKILALLPGPPRELQPMFEAHVVPVLSELAQGGRLVRRVIKIAGKPESHVEEIAHPIYSEFAAGDISIETTILATPGQIELHLSARGSEQDPLELKLEEAVGALVAALGPAVFSVDGRALEQVVADELLARSWRLAVAESCTGGLVGGRLTDIPGSSAWFAGGVVAYANEIKETEIGVSSELMKQHGAVSEAVAVAMADGVRQRFKTDVGLAVTGIAGPSGGSAEKPVGTVMIAVSSGPAIVRTYRFVGDRTMVRQQSVIAAVELLRQSLQRREERAER